MPKADLQLVNAQEAAVKGGASVATPPVAGALDKGKRLLWTQASHSQSGCNYLTSPLLEFDFDEQNEANQRDDHEESQEDTHVEVFRGLLWKRTTQSCQRILHACLLISLDVLLGLDKKVNPKQNHWVTNWLINFIPSWL